MAERTRRGTPTTYRGVRMRSRLEAMVASWLDNRGIPWEYEPMCFADQHGQYYPDFRLHPIRVIGDKDATLYLEVKPIDFGGSTLDTVLARMESIWESEPRALLAICSTNDACFNQFPLRWRHHETWTAPDAIWVECVRCRYVGVDTLARLGQPFEIGTIPTPEPWRCPTCKSNPGFMRITPWQSAEYHAMVGGTRTAAPAPTGRPSLGQLRRTPRPPQSALGALRTSPLDPRRSV